MAKQVRLMELCISPSKGGLELYFASICNALSHHFAMTTVLFKDSQIKNKIASNITPVSLGKKMHYFPLLTAFKLAKIIDTKKIQVIHIHWNKDLTLAVFAKLLSRSKPKIILMRHMQFPAKKNSVLHRFLYKNIDHIIAITQTMANDLKRFIPADVIPEVSVNYLGVQPIQKDAPDIVQQQRLVYDAEKNLFLIGLVGRIDPYKGHDLLLDALILAKEKKLPFKALIIGDAMQQSYLHTLQQKVIDNQLQNHVVFTGFVNAPRTLMQACDTVVLTTVEETFGLVLIEAMSVGVPVIGSNRGGVPEIIDHQRTGLLFESENSSELFHALSFIYNHKKTAQAYAKEAMSEVQNKFSAEKHLNRMLTCLNSYHT